MDGVLDNKPHRCVRGSNNFAIFDCTPGIEMWSWKLEDFVEVKKV